MSATNRGVERELDDFYETPQDCVRQMLVRVSALTQPSTVVCDLGAGSGAILREIYATNKRAFGVEIDHARATHANLVDQLPVWHDDVLNPSVQVDPHEDTGIEHTVSNPPFKFADEFIRAGLDLIEDGGLSVNLLRLGYLGSGRKRIALLRDLGLFHVMPLTKRPSFCVSGRCKVCKVQVRLRHDQTRVIPHDEFCPPTGKESWSTTDATDYMWAVWRKGHTGVWTGEVIPHPDNDAKLRAVYPEYKQ